MSNCSFGRPSNLTFKTLCQGSKLIVDSSGNLSVIKVTSEQGCFKCIEPCVPEDGVFITAPVFFQRQGIARLTLNENVSNIFNNNPAVLDASFWNLDYETAPSMALISGNVITVPTTFNTTCIPNQWSMLLEIKITLEINVTTFGNSDRLSLSVVTNENAPLSTTYHEYSFDGNQSISLHDTIRCFPGDTLNIVVNNPNAISKVTIIQSNASSHVEFKVVSLIETIV